MSRFISALAGVGLALIAPMAIAQDASGSAGQAQKTEFPDFVLGYHNAPVELIVYAPVLHGGGGNTGITATAFFNYYVDYLTEKYIEKGQSANRNIKLIFRPLSTDQTNAAGVIITRCMDSKYFFDFAKTYARFSSMDHFLGRKIENGSDFLSALERSTVYYGLDREGIEKCLSDNDLYQNLMRHDEAMRQLHGVSAWPTFIINGEKQKDIGDIDELDALIQSYLGKR